MDYLDDMKNSQDNRFKEELNGTDWLGIIVDNKDELCSGRCKVRVFEKFDELSDDLLPWAYPIQSNVFASSKEDGGYGSFSYPKIGTLVRVKFQNGDIYSPEYYNVQNINTKLQTEIKESYENCQVITFDEDEDLKIIYTKNKGLILWHKGSFLNVNKDKHITIEHVGGTSKIELIDGNLNITSNSNIIEKSPLIHLDSSDTKLGPSGFEACTRCDSLMQLLTQLATMIDAKVPSTPGAATSLINTYKAKICSTTVTVAS